MNLPVFENDKADSGTSPDKNEIDDLSISLKLLFELVLGDASVQIGNFHAVSLKHCKHTSISKYFFTLKAGS